MTEKRSIMHLLNGLYLQNGGSMPTPVLHKDGRIGIMGSADSVEKLSTFLADKFHDLPTETAIITGKGEVRSVYIDNDYFDKPEHRSKLEEMVLSTTELSDIIMQMPTSKLKDHERKKDDNPPNRQR